MSTETTFTNGYDPNKFKQWKHKAKNVARSMLAVRVGCFWVPLLLLLLVY
jgi:hypothetical protein